MPVHNGSMTPSSASGRTGDRNRTSAQETGTRAICTWKAAANINIISSTTATLPKFGYKDIIPLWKAERFDPKALMRLYRQAGAKYFFSMGVHCDNFDLWNSRHHRWNAVQHGSEERYRRHFRDAARDEGLRFGVSEHVWGSYNWWVTNKGADKQGPYAGVPYDGNDPANQDLYFPPHAPAKEAWAEQGNEPEEWKREWFLRVQDLIDRYQPDIFYEDGGIPFGRWGRSLVAHYYNQALRWHAGAVDVVYTSKRRSECEAGTCVLDVERGVVDEIELPTISDRHLRRRLALRPRRPSTKLPRRLSIFWWISSAAMATFCSISRCRGAACPTMPN